MMGRCADCCYSDREQGVRRRDVAVTEMGVCERRPVEFDELRCRLNPPGPDGWPLVEPDDWCGQFAPGTDWVVSVFHYEHDGGHDEPPAEDTGGFNV